MYKFVLLIVSILIITQPLQAVAVTVPDRYTIQNIKTAYLEPPESFTADAQGGFYGSTVSGKRFTQKPITTTPGLNLHKFIIDDAFFYISNKGVIFASSDIVAASIYLALV